jgi:hypothetical protein
LTAIFTVQKDFVPNNTASVTVSLSCTSGLATPSSASATETLPATFAVTGYVGTPSCTATEAPVPAGYTSTATCSASLSAGTCTVTNTAQALFTVHKDFTDNNLASVTVALSCAPGTPSPASALASEGAPAVFMVTGATGATLCTATESGVPAGYTIGSCQATMTAGNCTIVNAAVATFTVSKNFIPDSGATVSVSVTCTSGVASPPSANITESSPWGFTVSGYGPGTTCTATESPIPDGYSSSGNCTAPISIPSHVGACTIVNTLATVGAVSAAPCASNCPVGGEVFLPRAVSGSGGSDSGLGLAVMILFGLAAVASIAGSWKMSRRSRG